MNASKNKIQKFEETGTYKLEGVFNQKHITLFSELLERQLKIPSQGEFGFKGFNRLAYDVGNDDKELGELLKKTDLGSFLSDLAGRPIIFTQGVAFEITQDMSKGYGWHFGNVSFNYIQPNDSGYSLWVPLDPINTNDQHGGMAWVPKNVMNARDRFNFIHKLSPVVRNIDNEESIEELRTVWNNQYSTGRFLGDLDRWLFEKVKEEKDFAVGDAFFFEKSVFHTGRPLGKGPMQRRRAFVFRFIDHDSRLARQQMDDYVNGFFAMVKRYDKPPTFYGHRFTDIKDGELIRNSKYCPPILYGKKNMKKSA